MLALWTLKESYVKARGLGLSIPLDRFAFDLSRPPSIRLSFARGFGDAARRWQLLQWQPATSHIVSLCAERVGSEAVEIGVWRTLPLNYDQPVSVSAGHASAGITLPPPIDARGEAASECRSEHQ